MKEQSERNKTKISEKKNILKQNGGKTASFFFALKQNKKMDAKRSEKKIWKWKMKWKEKCESEISEKKNTDAKRKTQK